MEPGKIGLLALILLLVLALWGLSFNHLMLSAVHPALADSRGVRVFWQEALFSAAIAVVVTVSMTWVGLLVINSLLVLPAAAARNISRNMFQYHLCSLLFAVGAGIAGLMTSYYIGSSAGASITLYLAGIFLVTFLLRKRDKLPKAPSGICLDAGRRFCALYGNSAEPRSPPLLPQLQQLPGRPAAEQAYQCPCDHIAGVVDPHIQAGQAHAHRQHQPGPPHPSPGQRPPPGGCCRKGSTGMP